MDRLPHFTDLAVFQAKAAVLRVARAWRNGLNPSLGTKWPLVSTIFEGPCWAESRSALWDRTAPRAERILQAGKIQNLRLASRSLDGCLVPAGEIFSFWRQVGWPGRLRGYTRGRELRQGCLIPAIGGGLCQLSNALYDCALQARFTVLERHPHSQIIPGSLAEQGRDATVFWNYVDLRFRSARSFQISAALTAQELVVQFGPGEGGQ